MNMLTNRNPFAEFDNLFRSMERNLESAWRQTSPGQGGVTMDIYEKPDAFYVRTTLPGVHQEDVEISIEKDVFTLKGAIRCDYISEDTKVYLLETPYGSFTRSVRLPENCNPDQAEAAFDLGVLTVRIPKVAKVSTPTKKIVIRQSLSQPTRAAIEGTHGGKDSGHKSKR